MPNKKLPQLPSLFLRWTEISALISISCITVILLWSMNDASFPIAVWKAKACVYLQPITSADPKATQALGIEDAMRTLKWNALGKRAICLYALSGLGMISTVVVLLGVLRQRTKPSIFLFLLVLLGWSGLIATRAKVDDWRTKRQIAAIFPQFEQAGIALRNRWPVESGEVPPGISFYVSAQKYPDVLLIRRKRSVFPFQENFGNMIARGQNGIIRFNLAAAYDCCVEYHPNGTVPAVYTSGFGHESPPVASTFLLKECWYLVRYGGTQKGDARSR